MAESKSGSRGLGLDQRHLEGEKREEKKVTVVPCSQEDFCLQQRPSGITS